jgi:hypothetical protein
MRISKGDLASRVVNDCISRVSVPRLPLETQHLLREMQLHLQNPAYVTALKFLVQEIRINNTLSLNNKDNAVSFSVLKDNAFLYL